MKKKSFISILMALALVMSPYMQASATEVSTDTTTIVSADLEIQPRDVFTLKEIHGLAIYPNSPEEFTVTPKKGSNLKFVGYTYGESCGVKIEVTKNGGWWPSKTVTVYSGASQSIYDLINNCNGEPYTIKLTFTGSYHPAELWGSFMQSDYA